MDGPTGRCNSPEVLGGVGGGGVRGVVGGGGDGGGGEGVDGDSNLVKFYRYTVGIPTHVG